MMITSAVSDSSLIYLNYIPVFSMHGNPGTKACHYRVQKKKKNQIMNTFSSSVYTLETPDEKYVVIDM